MAGRCPMGEAPKPFVLGDPQILRSVSAKALQSDASIAEVVNKSDD